MAQQRQLVKIDQSPRLDNLFYRRRVFANDHRPDLGRFAPQALVRHLGAIRFGGNTERYLNLLLRILRAHDQLHVVSAAMRVERLLENEHWELLQRTELLDDRRYVL